MEVLLWMFGGVMAAYIVAAIPVPAGLVAVLLEEGAKWGVIALGRRWLGKEWWKQGLLVGLFFGLTELVLYAPQMWEVGQLGVWGARALWTVPMHALTGTMVASGKWGIVFAVLIHGMFNYLVG